MRKDINFVFNTSDQNVFFTSDTHFGHENVIKFTNRPYKDADEMNQCLIDNWNSVVKENDIVFHLGDFSMNIGGNKIKEIINKLNGKIYLILGNHDLKPIVCNNLEAQFKYTSYQMFIRVDGQPIYLNHYPYLCYSGTYRTTNRPWQLFGHVHSGPGLVGLDTHRLVNLFPTQYDVGVDNNNYTPVNFLKVKEIINKRIENRMKDYEF